MDEKSTGEEIYRWTLLETLYAETYTLGFPFARIEVFFDFQNEMLIFRPVRMTGDHPVNDLAEEERVKMPKQYDAQKREVKRVVRLLKDEVYAACEKRGLTHEFHRHPSLRDNY